VTSDSAASDEKIAAAAHVVCATSLVALIFLCLAWEVALAPLRPGGSWLMLKALPLLAPLRGVLHARAHTLKWALFLILGYFAEGVVRGYAESGMAAALALSEAALAILFFASAILLVRARRA
jgi:uncharacterized membrane protein